ncbi:MAG: response regulator [Deltaproteobacteria bacterium]|nr:response regulator [Deltaproteobacteria bacterium]
MTEVADLALFLQVVRRKNAASLRWVALLVALLVPLFWLLDWFVIPQHVYRTLFLRGASSVYAIALLVAVGTHRAWVERHVNLLGFTLTLLLGWSIAMMCWLHQGYESPYYAGMILVIIGVGFFFTWNWRLHGLFNLLLYGFYMAPVLVGRLHVSQFSVALGNQFFLLSTMVITMASLQVRYGLELREFANRQSLEKTKGSLEQALGRLTDLDRLKSQFFSNVTHELRTPLTMILSPVESMLDGDLGTFDPTQRSYLETVKRNALKLLKLINDLLDLAKIEERFMRLRLDRTDLHALLSETVEYARPLAQRKGIELALALEAKPEDLHVDQEKMERVVVNLVSNALKFTGTGGKVTIRLAESSDEIHLAVSDTGVGIPEDKREAIFERFAQADGSVTRRYGGSGIGLAFAREIAVLHGGRIDVESEVGRGSTFTLCLKPGTAHIPPQAIDRRRRNTPTDSTRRREDREPLEWTLQLQERKDYRFLQLEEATERRIVRDRGDEPRATKVLVVEDNVEVLRFLHLQLQGEHAVYLAQDGKQGLELARRERPDVIVTDFMMPEMDGRSMIAALRSEKEMAATPVVMLTAKNQLEDRLQAHEAGADVYLAKPFSPEELRATVRKLLARRGREAATVLQAQTKSLEIVSAGLAHEIHNPLSYIKGGYFVIDEALKRIDEALKKEGLSDEERQQRVAKARSSAERMRTSVERGIERIEQVVALVRRYAREGYPNEPTDISLDAAVRDVVKLVAPRDARHVELAVELACPEATVRCVPEEMHQVIRNLTQNALDAVGDGGKVVVRTRRAGERVVLEVSDDGPGIPRELLTRIFTPFFTTKAPGKGMGLGLAIVHQVVTQAGGTIVAESEAGHGTTFRVELPAPSLPSSALPC